MLLDSFFLLQDGRCFRYIDLIWKKSVYTVSYKRKICLNKNVMNDSDIVIYMLHRLGGVIVSPCKVKPKRLHVQLVFVAALRKRKDGRSRVRKMCLGKVTFLPVDCCFRESARLKSGSKCRSSTKHASFIIVY